MPNGFIAQSASASGLKLLPSGKLAFTDDINDLQEHFKQHETQPTVKNGDRRSVPRLCVEMVITSNAIGKRKYNAKLIDYVEGNIDPTTDLSEDELGAVGDTETILFINLDKGDDDHVLTKDSQAPYAIGFLRSINDDGTWVVHGFAINTYECLGS